jgi:CheY-like chemotaxis protein
MKNGSVCIMLVDDSEDDNFFHERAIRKSNLEPIVIPMGSGRDALNYLKSHKEKNTAFPDLIFVDINMSCMNGWDFLDQYRQLDVEIRSRAKIVILTTSDDPDDISKAKISGIVSDYLVKPITSEMVEKVINEMFDEKQEG